MKRIEEMSRRELLKLFGIGVGAVIADPAVWPKNVQAQSKKITPRGTARNVIFIQNCGAMSQWETWDFRPTKWTDTFPGKDLDVQKVNSDFQIGKTRWFTSPACTTRRRAVPLTRRLFGKFRPSAALSLTNWRRSVNRPTRSRHL